MAMAVSIPISRPHAPGLDHQATNSPGIVLPRQLETSLGLFVRTCYGGLSQDPVIAILHPLFGLVFVPMEGEYHSICKRIHDPVF